MNLGEYIMEAFNALFGTFFGLFLAILVGIIAAVYFLYKVITYYYDGKKYVKTAKTGIIYARNLYDDYRKQQLLRRDLSLGGQ